MNDEQLDRRLDEALASLGRPRAGDGFTAEVLRRLKEEPRTGPRKGPQSRAHRWTAWVPAAVAATVLAVVGLWMLDREAPAPGANGARTAQEASVGSPGGPADPPPRSESRQGFQQQEIDKLQEDYLRLSQELAELKALVEESEPVLYLGGDDGLGLLLPRGTAPNGGIPAGRPAEVPRPVRIVPASQTQL